MYPSLRLQIVLVPGVVTFHYYFSIDSEGQLLIKVSAQNLVLV